MQTVANNLPLAHAQSLTDKWYKNPFGEPLKSLVPLEDIEHNEMRPNDPIVLAQIERLRGLADDVTVEISHGRRRCEIIRKDSQKQHIEANLRVFTCAGLALFEWSLTDKKWYSTKTDVVSADGVYQPTQDIFDAAVALAMLPLPIGRHSYRSISPPAAPR